MNLSEVDEAHIKETISAGQIDQLLRLKSALGTDARHVIAETHSEMAGGTMSINGFRVSDDAPNKHAIAEKVRRHYSAEMMLQ